MRCKPKRNIFNLFQVLTCENCPNKRNDEFIYIGRNVIAIYYVFDSCLDLEIDKDLIFPNVEKLKILLKDAILNQDKIFMCMLEDFDLENYYDVFEKVLDEGLSVQIIVI